MGFMESYKRLEKLCGACLNDQRRVSAYIDEMRSTPRGSALVSGWNEDLKRLKHYRWVRNQIVHDPNCNEKNMCSQADVQWIEGFYSRILHQTDPLALYRKATRHPKKRDLVNQKTKRNPSGCGMVLLVTAGIVAIAILWLLMRG